MGQNGCDAFRIEIRVGEFRWWRPLRGLTTGYGAGKPSACEAEMGTFAEVSSGMMVTGLLYSGASPWMPKGNDGHRTPLQTERTIGFRSNTQPSSITKHLE
jgi:hypothetical protein